MLNTHDRDQKIFLNLKEGKIDRVAFGNNSSIKILGKCLLDLGSDKAKSTNVLLVEDLKHNLLRVSKMCD